ncbi:MAG: glycosyltransferase family 4 protein, partial [Myxococcota bacterium]
MKIGIVTEYYYPYLGGIAEHVHYTYTNFTRLGHDVKIITPLMKDLKFGADTRSDGWAPESSIIRAGDNHPFYFNDGFVRFTSPFGLGKRLKEVFAAERFDILHVHAPLVPVLPMTAIAKADCPVIGTCHTQVKRSLSYTLFHPWFKRIADRLDGCIAVSPLAAETVEKHFNLSPTIIPNGIDTRLYNPLTPPASEFAGDRMKNIVFLGRFDPHNGLPVLLEAFREIHRSAPLTRLIVVGDGPLKTKYRKSIPRELACDVHFVGMQYLRKPAFYTTADVFVNPAFFHAQSIVCLEAMASGAPIVASDIPGFRWLMQEDAIYAMPGNSSALAAAVVNLLSDDELRSSMKIRL